MTNLKNLVDINRLSVMILESSVISLTGMKKNKEETQGWCTGKTQRDRMGREAGEGIGMWNTCKFMADSCQCMAKTTTIL